MKTVKKKHKWTNILYLAKSNGDFRDEMLTRVEIASTKLIRKISKSVHWHEQREYFFKSSRRKGKIKVQKIKFHALRLGYMVLKEENQCCTAKHRTCLWQIIRYYHIKCLNPPWKAIICHENKPSNWVSVWSVAMVAAVFRVLIGGEYLALVVLELLLELSVQPLTSALVLARLRNGVDRFILLPNVFWPLNHWVLYKDKETIYPCLYIQPHWTRAHSIEWRIWIKM